MHLGSFAACIFVSGTCTTSGVFLSATFITKILHSTHSRTLKWKGSFTQAWYYHQDTLSDIYVPVKTWSWTPQVIIPWGFEHNYLCLYIPVVCFDWEVTQHSGYIYFQVKCHWPPGLHHLGRLQQSTVLLSSVPCTFPQSMCLLTLKYVQTCNSRNY